MRVGLQLPSFSWPGGVESIAPRLTEIGQAAEAGGFASLWVMDHLFQLPPDTGWNGPDEPMLEAFTTLAFLARATRRIALGPLVGGVHFRHPGFLVKTATTLDVLAGGRTYLGLGAGWYEREARGLGIPFASRRERFERLEEQILNPAPVSRPRPRILVGGGGERRTLRLVAEYADACNIPVPDPGESRHKLDVLKRHCEEVGRPFEEIETTALVEVDLRPGRMSPSDVVAALRAQGDEGIEHVIVNMPDAHLPERLETMGREVIPAVTELAAA